MAHLDSVYYYDARPRTRFGFVALAIQSDRMPNVDVMIPLYISELVIIGMLLLGSWKFDTLEHPATLLALAVNLFNCLLEPLGRSESVQMALRAVIRG